MVCISTDMRAWVQPNEVVSDDPYLVFGSPDDMKLKSSMTLFEAAEPENKLFGRVLEKYFHGERDQRTLEILATQEKSI